MEFRIMVVDDSKSARIVLEAIFRDCMSKYPGTVLTLAEDGHVALRHAKEQPYHLVFCDVEMTPDMDGYKTCTMLKEINPQCVVVMLTGRKDTEGFQSGKAAGCNRYLLKPPNPSDINTIVGINHRRVMIMS